MTDRTDTTGNATNEKHITENNKNNITDKKANSEEVAIQERTPQKKGVQQKGVQEKSALAEKGTSTEKGTTTEKIPAVPATVADPHLEGLLRSMQSRFASLEIIPDPYIVKVKIEEHELLGLLGELKHGTSWKMDLLLDLTAVDYKEYFSLVYVLYSLSYGHRLMVKCNINNHEDPVAPSISHIYPAADVMEREVYDLMGIDFWGHPRLGRILLPDDFIGHPLRKDFKLGTDGN